MYDQRDLNKNKNISTSFLKTFQPQGTIKNNWSIKDPTDLTAR
jgi:hypothetical protein